MELQWTKCIGNVWCGLETVNLDGIGDVAGVYLIWHGATPGPAQGSAPTGTPARWVRVGQGNIKERIAQHRNDPQILAFRQHRLFVTWAAVPDKDRDGVEAFLAAYCNPLVGERFPQRYPITVNLPK